MSFEIVHIPRGRLLWPVIAIALLAAAVVGMIAWQGSTSAHSETSVQGVVDSLPDVDAHDTTVAAYVNGVAIPEWKVDFLRGASAQSLTSPADGILDSLIDQELFYEQAAERGLVPSDEEVQQYMDTTRASMSPEDKELFDSLNASVYGFKGGDDYWSDPGVFQDTKRMLAVANYLRTLGGDTTEEQADARQQAADRLRQSASIVIN